MPNSLLICVPVNKFLVWFIPRAIIVFLFWGCADKKGLNESKFQDLPTSDGDIDLALGSNVSFKPQGDTTGLSTRWATIGPSIIVLENTIR